MESKEFKQRVKTLGSQREFAERSGYCKRSIELMCNGRPVSIKAVKILEALEKINHDAS